MRTWVVANPEKDRVQETADGGEIRITRQITVGVGGGSRKRYDGTIVDILRVAEKFDDVDAMLREAVRETAASTKTVRSWLYAAALRKLELAADRQQIFDATLAARKGLSLRDRRDVQLGRLERIQVTTRANRRLAELETVQISRPLLVDGAGQPLQAAA